MPTSEFLQQPKDDVTRNQICPPSWIMTSQGAWGHQGFYRTFLPVIRKKGPVQLVYDTAVASSHDSCPDSCEPDLSSGRVPDGASGFLVGECSESGVSLVLPLGRVQDPCGV
ncbi:hypothetical protein JTE90_024545 [Oedothorax gibbosus]|uniref:Uncharacterized protein n=1 Tax=Oedothorax gibbosus TaxID=931172 RepID=A0AAV6VDS4_9ARAC|nr:hypothetical protein JTE90_024545 [Oedothorax gibbosus]